MSAKITQKRIEALIHRYRTSNDASAATGYHMKSLNRVCRRYGLQFRYRVTCYGAVVPLRRKPAEEVTV